jgi:hypothetical protein
LDLASHTWTNGGILPGRVTEVAFLRGSERALVLTDKGLWLATRQGERREIEPNDSYYVRICPLPDNGIGSPICLCFSTYSIYSIFGEKGGYVAKKVGKLLSVETNASTPIVAGRDRKIRLPLANVAIDPQSGTSSTDYCNWPKMGIYDVVSNANRYGACTVFRAKTDPSDNTVYQFVSGSLYLVNVCNEPRFIRIRFPKNQRITRSFLTDRGELWYEVVQRAGKEGIVLKRVLATPE